MKKTNIILFGVFFCIGICSCTEKAKILIDSDEPVVLVFDQKDTVKISQDTVLDYSISIGRHSVKINNEMEEEIFIPNIGGILNVNKKRYVRMIFEFVDDNEESTFLTKAMNKIPNAFLRDNLIEIDSMIYIYRSDSTINFSNFSIKNYILQLNNKENRPNSLKLYSADLFIPTDWDYGLSDHLPDSIESAENNQLSAKNIKTKVMPLNEFKTLVLLAANNFIVLEKNEILSSFEDNLVDSEKQKNQMEF